MLMKLAAETAICGDDIDGLFLSWEAEIYDDRTGAERRETGLPEPSDDEESDVLRLIGTATVERFCFEEALNHGEQIWNVTDARSQTWHELYVVFMRENGYKRMKGLESGCRLDVLLIEDILLDHDYRGRGVEVAVAARLIETVGIGCGLALYSFGEFLWEAPIYSPLGFMSSKHELGAGFLYLGLERILPEVRDLRESAWRKKAQVDPEQLYETWCPRRKVCAPIARIVREKPPVGLAESEDEADPKVLA